MNNVEIKQLLHHYIETAQENKLKAIYTMVEDDIQSSYDFWNDKDFISELERREANYLNDPSSAYELDASLAEARLALKKSRLNK